MLEAGISVRVRSISCTFCAMSRKNQQRTLLGFFGWNRGTVNESVPSTTSVVSEVSEDFIEEVSEDHHVTEDRANWSTLEVTNDIGYYVSIGDRPDNNTLHELFTNHWRPPVGFKFPHSIHVKCNKDEKRYLKQNHLDSHPWVVFFGESTRSVLFVLSVLRIRDWWRATKSSTG